MTAPARTLPPPGGGAKPEPLYKKREPIHPKLVHGRYRRLKWIVMAVTLGIYYLLPWLRWDRGEGHPDQAVLLDLANRRFYFFFVEVWPQDIYLLTGLLIMAALGLFLVTALAGRVWCGYTCPQTVWTDLFIAVERFFEGDRAARLRLDKKGWSLDKVARRTGKHATWLLIGLLTGGAWVFYFTDAPTLLSGLLAFEAPTMAWVFIGLLTFTTWWLGGMMREQVCTYMCPWPRIQGALLDEDSLVVTYRDWRGEPRGAPRKSASGGVPLGDCVDCGQCVAACPTGVDIREGQQLGCITCALCIDACDDVMDRVGKPRGLIAYDTLANQALRAQGLPPRLRLLRPRILLYGAALALVAVLFLFGLVTRSQVELNVLHDRNPLFVTLADGSIRNGYTLKLLNKTPELQAFRLELDGLPQAQLTLAGGFPDAIPVAADSVGVLRIFIAVPPGTLKGEATDFTFVLVSESGLETRAVSVFRGPAP